MKKDAEVQLLMRERAKGNSQELAAARAGMSVRTARSYERRAQLPSQRKQPRTYRTRPDPFAEDWPWVQAQLERDSALQAHTLFALLCEQYPGRYQSGQLRTLQRRITTWRSLMWGSIASTRLSGRSIRHGSIAIQRWPRSTSSLASSRSGPIAGMTNCSRASI